MTAAAIPTESEVLFDPARFAAEMLYIRNREKRLAPLVWNRAQRHFHGTRSRRDLILKARQLGFSTYIQGELFRRAITGSRTTLTLSNDSENTSKLRRMADRFYDHMIVKPARKYASATLTTYPETDSTAIVATAGNLETGRGDTYTDIHGSEVAFWPDAGRIIAGAMQGGNPDVILESTPNGAQGYFYERCMEAQRGKGIWRLHFYPWWWDSEYAIALLPGEIIDYEPDEYALVEKHGLKPEQIKWRRYKQQELGRLFIQEYPEDPLSCFITSGHSYFGDVSGAFSAPLHPDRISGHVYVAGLDWGQSGDPTAMIVLDATSKQMVDCLNIIQLDWAEIRRQVYALAKRWLCKVIHAESNSIGSVNIEELRRMGAPVVPFETTNESKSLIMAALHEALRGTIQLQDVGTLKHEINAFVSTQTASGLWRLAAAGSGRDDMVIALALAWYAVVVLAQLQDDGGDRVIYQPLRIEQY
jgi:hypothetical protein